ncbi:MAG: hypothetical protein LBV72_02700 [Tannerella sp.]|jgi:hypothetical protein|nr:hypothetical protein [Tannerella sp.]
MKHSITFFKILILSVITSSFLSCNKDDTETEVDTSLLVGIWDSRLIYSYHKSEGEEWTDYNEYPGFVSLSFDGVYYGMWGPTMNTNGAVKRTYSYDAEKQTITLSDGTQMNVLKLTESELEIEGIYEKEDIYHLQRTTYERRIE